MSTPVPKVSFIIPSYNQGRFIGRTLDGILNQNLPADTFEVLVFDGGSTDDTTDILSRHPLRPRWVSRKDKGQSDAINQGLAAASGEIIAWINSDDVYPPDALRKVIAAFDAEPQTEVIYGRAHLIDEAGRTIGEYPVEPWNFDRLASSCFLCQPAVFFRRRLIARYGVLDERLHYAMDYEYWLRIGRDTPFRHLDAPLASSRIYPETKSLRDKPGVFREGMEVAHRHTGRWVRDWVRGYGYWRAKAWCEKKGLRSPLLVGIAVALSRLGLNLRHRIA